MSLVPFFHDLRRPYSFFDNTDNIVSSLLRAEFFNPSKHFVGHRDIGSNIIANKDKFQINLDVQHFAPEEIAVKTVDGHVVVEGNHEERQDGHGYVSRRFVRRYALPEGCLAGTVESRLSSDGVLTVTAPRKLPLPAQGEKIVPITYTGPVKRRLENGGNTSEKKYVESK